MIAGLPTPIDPLTSPSKYWCGPIFSWAAAPAFPETAAVAKSARHVPSKILHSISLPSGCFRCHPQFAPLTLSGTNTRGVVHPPMLTTGHSLIPLQPAVAAARRRGMTVRAFAKASPCEGGLASSLEMIPMTKVTEDAIRRREEEARCPVPGHRSGGGRARGRSRTRRRASPAKSGQDLRSEGVLRAPSGPRGAMVRESKSGSEA